MTQRPSWRVVADLLANRMRHHAHCDRHPATQPDPDCPFCEDRAAFQTWERKTSGNQPIGDRMTDTKTLPTWDEMSDLDKGAALLHLHKREYEGAGYAVENYPVKYFDDPRLTGLERRAACHHAATFAREAERLADDDYRRLYELALAEPDRRCLWAARDEDRVVTAETREYAVELLTRHWPDSNARLAAMVPPPAWWSPVDESKWALLTRDEPGGEWREVPYRNVAG